LSFCFFNQLATIFEFIDSSIFSIFIPKRATAGLIVFSFSIEGLS